MFGIACCGKYDTFVLRYSLVLRELFAASSSKSFSESAMKVIN